MSIGDKVLKQFNLRLDLVLLLFMVLLSMDKVVLKPFAILLALILIAKGISKQDLRSAPIFYILIAALGAVNFVFLNSDFSVPHLISFSIGVGYWVMSFLAFIILANRVRKAALPVIENTLTAFFFINLVWSVGQLVQVMLKSQSINPYGLNVEPYGNSTGDYIQGIFMAPCYINMFVNAGFAIYFLYRQKYIMSFLAGVLACLTTSNFANVIFIAMLVVAFIALNYKKARLTIFLQLAFYVVFYSLVSYGNLAYFTASFSTQTEDTTESNTLRSIAVKPVPKDSLIAAVRPSKEVADTEKRNAITGTQPDTDTAASTSVPITENKIKVGEKQYGKLISFQQTRNFLLSGTGNFLFGGGIGEFSSQLALRTSDIKVKSKSRLFERIPKYISPDFFSNHYQVFATLYSMHEGYHSIRHLPNSVANQLPGEYGILGVVLFLLFYVWFFMKKVKRLSYAILIGIMTGYFMLFDYMFEYLSLVVFFELFFLVDMKRHSIKNEQQS